MTDNPIVLENELNRTSVEEWEALGMSPGGAPRDVWDASSSVTIEGFATDISVDHSTPGNPTTVSVQDQHRLDVSHRDLSPGLLRR